MMGDAELRVVLAVCRKTRGWQKDEDVISLSQLEKITGLSRQGVIDGTKNALEHDFIKRVKKGDSYSYSLNIKPVVKPVDQSLVKPVDTQKKLEKKSTRGKQKPLAAVNSFILREAEASVRLSQPYVKPISGGSGEEYTVLDEDEVYEETEENESKPKGILPKTPAAMYLAEQPIGKWKNHWKGFKNKKQEQEWAEIEDAYNWKTIKEKIDYFVAQEVAPKKIVPDVIKALKDNVKPDRVKHKTVVAPDGGRYI